MTEQPDFESIKRTNMYGEDYWSARELMPLLGYGKKWQNFEGVIKKAMLACELARQHTPSHFFIASKGIIGGKGAIQIVNDYHLSRYALHLILLFSDIRKPKVAHALGYFTLTSLEKGFDYSAMVRALDGFAINPIAITQERRTLEEIMRAFSHLHMIQQYKIPPYRIDLYMPTYKIAIECDEQCHQRYDQKNEACRQAYIEQKLACTFVRYNPDDPNFHIGDVIHKIMILLYGKERHAHEESIA